MGHLLMSERERQLKVLFEMVKLGALSQESVRTNCIALPTDQATTQALSASRGCGTHSQVPPTIGELAGYRSTQLSSVYWVFGFKKRL